MKAAPFSYVRPTRLDDVVAELERAESTGGGKVIAGGQSLLPVLAMRLGRPKTLVDITRVRELAELQDDVGTVRIGAAVRQRRVERELARRVPLVGRALPWVGHREIRSRGTVCGSLAHADPSAELPAVALCLDATLTVVGPEGRRRVPAAEFFTGAMSTVLAPAELVTSVTVPTPRAGEGFGFEELARRHGDFALAGAAARVRRDGDAVTEAALVGFGVADRAQHRDLTVPMAQAVSQHGADEKALTTTLAEAVDQIAAEVVTASDAHASQQYRRRLMRVLGTRALVRAWTDSRRRTHA
ncbi:FAD binding domain-containing protein [Nesterenkonia sp.]|uniref:FAD binding domain-containing protein n=1 Tax=Nesterenkonia sp. TaxID=704201 RepID=UPI00260DB81E|nr:FAD binding domain-containing protein [Nesterenkonia sp.]